MTTAVLMTRCQKQLTILLIMELLQLFLQEILDLEKQQLEAHEQQEMQLLWEPHIKKIMNNSYFPVSPENIFPPVMAIVTAQAMFFVIIGAMEIQSRTKLFHSAPEGLLLGNVIV